MSGLVKHLITYPIKGLSGQVLESVGLQIERGFPLDRAFAFARYDSGMEAAKPRPMPKSKFHVLARDAALARLDTKFDTDNMTLSIQDGETNLIYDLSTDIGIAQASTYLSGVVGLPPDKRPDFIKGGNIRFTDVCMTSPQMMHAISIINLGSIGAFEKAIGKPVDYNRFRGNLIVDGLEPFSEFNLLDREINIGDARLRILKRTQRCPATQVNLMTAQRDIDVPELLNETYGHRDMGVYAEVVGGGTIKTGSAVTL